LFIVLLGELGALGGSKGLFEGLWKVEISGSTL
jgi:hypothetical protein